MQQTNKPTIIHTHIHSEQTKNALNFALRSFFSLLLLLFCFIWDKYFFCFWFFNKTKRILWLILLLFLLASFVCVFYILQTSVVVCLFFEIDCRRWRVRENYVKKRLLNLIKMYRFCCCFYYYCWNVNKSQKNIKTDKRIDCAKNLK